MTHCERVLAYMEKYGGITHDEAYRQLGCARLSGRIYDLKHKGIKINKTMIPGTNRFGEPCHYARYYLDLSQDDTILHI